MEEDIYKYGSQANVPKSALRIEERLKGAIEVAGKRQAYESAHDQELQRALAIVADFIKKKKRVCYGGTAMNAILPKSKQFYDTEYDLPDYDFYTPAPEKDVEELVRDLKAAGYKDVHHRVGIHEGTKKILVNFIAVADMTHIEKDLFAILYQRSIVKDGIHYTDPDTLRMMMYLELSRPRGQVDRWEKVFERLQLINEEFPIRAKGGGTSVGFRKIPFKIRSIILDFCIQNQRILCNGPIGPLYAQGIRGRSIKFQIREGGAILFTSPDPKKDAQALKQAFKQQGASDVRLYLHKAHGEVVPERVELRVEGQPVCLLTKEVACHSYNSFPLGDGRILYIGSLEFLITLYLSLVIFTKDSSDFLGTNAMAQVRNFIGLSLENIKAKNSIFPPFALNCRGHQTGYVSLIRQKVLRIQREKAKTFKAVAAGSKKVSSKQTKTRRRNS